MKCKNKVRLALIFLLIILAMIGLYFGVYRHGDVSVTNIFHDTKQLPEDLEGWNLSLLMYDSAVNNGRVAVNSDVWNATVYTEARDFRVQVNLSNTSLVKSYAPGELQISVDTLGQAAHTDNEMTEPTEPLSISADSIDKVNKEFDWSYRYDSDSKKFIFTNNNTIEMGSAFESTIQMTYRFDAYSVQNGADVTINADLNGELNSINSLNFKYTSNKRPGENDLEFSKIVSYDGLGANASNYIWVRIQVGSDFLGDNVRCAVFDSYIDISVPAGCIVYNPQLERILPDGNSGFWIGNLRYYYMGFPKSSYENVTVDLTSNWCGKYVDSYYVNGDPNKELETISSVTKTISLNDYKFDYTGELYTIKCETDGTKASYSKIINEKYGENIYYYTSGTIIYTGNKYKARFGDDLLYIDHSKLSDEEYYFKSLEVPENLYNGALQIIPKDKYNIDLYVRYRGTNTYVKYGETFKNGTAKTIDFTSDEFIAGWYVEIYDLEESLLFSRSSSPSKIGFKTYVHIQKSSGINETGRIHNLNYLQVFKKSGNNYTLINEPTNHTYNSNIYTAIPSNDLANYGVYLQRGTAYKQYGRDYVYTRITTSVRDVGNDNNYFYRMLQADTFLDSSCTGTNAYDGYNCYCILPEGTELNATKDELINLVELYNYRSIADKIVKQDDTRFTTEELFAFLKEHLTITIDTDYKNTGKTWIGFKEDFSDNLLDIYNASGEIAFFPIEYQIPIKIPYESYFIYGSSYEFNSYTGFIKDTEPFDSYTETDVDDVDNDGYTTDFHCDDDWCGINVVPAISSYQEASTSVWTDNTENRYVSNYAVAKYAGTYKYRLKVRTGASEITNLVIYDNIEKDSTNWSGIFRSIDTSFALSQGFVPKIYVSNSKNAGTLESNPTAWRIYDSTSSTNFRIKSVAVDYGNAIIPAGFVTFVEIEMRAPGTTTLDTVTKNYSRASWNSLDVDGNIINDKVDFTSNTVYVGFKNTVQNIVVAKDWDDNNNAFNVRPNSTIVHLLKDGVEIDQVELNDTNGWTHTFNNLQVCDDEFNRYEYTIYEEPINHYDTNIQYQEIDPETMTTNITINSSVKPEDRYDGIVGYVMWDDDDDEKGKRPSNVTINLYRNDEKIDSYTTDEDNDWYYEFTLLPKWKNPTEEYTYSIEEEEQEYYSSEYEMADVPASGIKLKFSSDSKARDIESDYLEIYYRLNEQVYKVGRYRGTEISNKEITIPTNDFYLYWTTDNSDYAYSFSMDYIRPIIYEDGIIGTVAELPDIIPDEVEEDEYPEVEQSSGERVQQMWHYSLENPFNSTKNGIDIYNSLKSIPSTVLVHHYIEGTTTSVADDEIINGYVWDEYVTSESPSVPSYYELVDMPVNNEGEFAETQTVVIYYYKLRDYSYRVEYYYDGIIDSSKTEQETATYGTKINTYDEKIIDGYVFNNDAGKPLTITDNEETNVIKVYYIKRTDLAYTIHYRDQDTNEDMVIDYVENKTYLESVTENAIDIPGYNKVAPTTQTITIQVENNDIIFYYKKINDISYVVHYREQDTNIELSTPKEVGNRTYLEEVTEEAINIPGYDAVNPASQTFTLQLENNEITFYYTKSTNLKYTIHYREQETNNQLADDKVVGNKVLGSTVFEYAIDIEGYTKIEPTRAKIIITSDTNEYTFYYKKRKYNYRIEYYYNNIIDDSETEIMEAEYNSEITLFKPKLKVGYKFDKVEGAPLTITANEETNIIKVFYEIDENQRKNAHYTVAYFKDNVLVKEDMVERTGNIQVLGKIPVDRSLFTDDDKYYGYTINCTKPSNVPDEVEDDTIINVFYIPDETSTKELNYTVEYYKNGVLMDEDTEYETQRVQVLEPDFLEVNKTKINLKDKYENCTFDHTNPEIIPDRIETDSIIKVYYANRNDLQYTVHYKEDITKERIAEDKVVNNQTFGDIVEESAIDIVGYNKLDPTSANIEITTEQNEFTFYYTRGKFNYTVEYYYDNKIDDSKTEIIESLYQHEITSFTEKNEVGYVREKTEGLPLTISANEDENVIKVYYEKDPSQTKTLKYTVNYYKDGYIQKNDTQIETQEVQVLSDNILNVDKTKINITDKYEDYTFEKIEPSEIPDTIEDGGIIEVFYIKTKHPYTIEYYYNNIKDTDATESGQAYTNDVINTYTNKDKEGYEFDDVDGLPLIISSTEENIIKVYYLPIRKITINHIDKNTNEVIKTEEKTGKEGYSITTGAEDFEGYICVEKPEVEKYTYAEDEQIVNYYYARLSSGVIEKHIDLISGKLIADDVHYDGYEGKEYTTSIKDIENYKHVSNKQYYRALIEKDPSMLDGSDASTVDEYLEKQGIDADADYIPANYTGIMTDDLIEVRYYYVPYTKLIVKYIDIGSGEEIAEAVEKDGEVDEEYTTALKEIDKNAANRGEIIGSSFNTYYVNLNSKKEQSL